MPVFFLSSIPIYHIILYTSQTLKILIKTASFSLSLYTYNIHTHHSIEYNPCSVRISFGMHRITTLRQCCWLSVVVIYQAILYIRQSQTHSNHFNIYILCIVPYIHRDTAKKLVHINPHVYIFTTKL